MTGRLPDSVKFVLGTTGTQLHAGVRCCVPAAGVRVIPLRVRRPRMIRLWNEDSASCRRELLDRTPIGPAAPDDLLREYE